MASEGNYKVKLTSKGKNNTWSYSIDAESLIDAVLKTRESIEGLCINKDIKPIEKPLSVNVVVFSDHEKDMKTFTIYNVSSHEAWKMLKNK